MSLLQNSNAITPVSGFELKSGRFDRGSNAYLSKTPTQDGNLTTWTWSSWFKLGSQINNGGYQGSLFYWGTNNLDNGGFWGGMLYQDKLNFRYYGSGSPASRQITTSQVFRDPSAWYHVTFVSDTNNANADDRWRLYINGERIAKADMSDSSYDGMGQDFDQNANGVNSNETLYISRGILGGGGTQDFDGYQAEIFFVDGSALTPASFGETDENTGQWKPKNSTDIKEAVTWGVNGFYLPFSLDALNNSFTDSATYEISALTTGSGNYTVPADITSLEVLVVAGGGGAGGDGGGGGGAGGVVHHTALTVTPGETIAYSVGAGGAGGGNGAKGSNGSNTTFGSMTAVGGGAGGSYPYPANAATAGGSGGGGGGDTPARPGASGTQANSGGGTGYGNDGGDSGAGYLGGGGGGANAVGGTGANPGGSGDGGAGKLFSSFVAYGTDSSNNASTGSNGGYFAGGGGGGDGDPNVGAGAGGVGGGGAGSTDGGGTGGQGNTGGGGGGSDNGTGGGGGSGVVLIKHTAIAGKNTITETGDMENVRIKRQNLEHKTDATGGSHFIGPKVGTGCVTMDGSGEYLSAAYSTDWNFGTGDFTIEWWMNSKSLPASGSAVPNNHSPIIGYAYYGDPTGSRWNGWGFGIREQSAGNQYLMPMGMLAINTGVYATPDDVIRIPTGSWHHYAFVRQGTVAKVYVDGVLGSTWTTTSGAIDASDAGTARNLRIGQFNYDDAYFGDLKAYIDEVRISTTARYTANFTPETTAFTSDANTKLLLHCDGAMGSTTFTDSSSGGHTITAAGSARVIAPKFGKGCYRNNGSGNGLAVPSGQEPWAEFDAGDFTVEAWVCLDDISTDNQQFFTHRWGVNTGDWVFWWSSSNGLTWSGANDTLNQGGTTGWASNTWVHIAACRTGQTNRLFVNGAIVATNISASENYNSTAKVYLMSYGSSSGDTSSGAATGFMDEARIIQGKALYAGNFTPATTAYSSDANTKLLLHCDGSDGGTTFTDSSGSAHTMTANGNVHTDTTIKKIGTASGQFDGTGDFISTPNSADFNFGTGDFTFEGWYYTTDTTDQVLFSQHVDASNRWYLRLDNRTAQQGIGLYNHNGSIDIEAADKTWPGVNQWVHMALVRYNGVISIYINGESVKLKTNSGGNGSFANNTGDVRIGDYNGGNNYSGYMDEIRISNSARYTATFTPETSAYNDDRDTPFLMHMDGGILIDEATGFATGAGEGTYTYNGAVNSIFYDTTTPNLPLATNKSMVNFPGNGYLSMPNSTDFEFGTGDFTIECWMYLTKDQDNRSLFGTDASGSNSGCQIEFVSADEHIATYDYDLEGNWNEVTKSNKPIPLGKWIHFAYVRESLAFYLYIDGVRQSSTGFTSTNAVGHSSGPYWGYHRTDSGRYLDDVYLDQMRISNNARYSVNFTPPTAPFTADANTLSLIQSDWSEGSIGSDHSGNYNYFTPTNMGADASTKDAPNNNFCTVNPLTFPRQGDTTSLWGRATEGNLRWTSAGSQWGGHCFFGGTFSIAPNTGKYYWEMLDIGNKSVGTFANYGWGTGLIVVNDGPNGSGYIGRNTSVGSNTGYRYNKSGNGVGSRCQYNGTASAENIAVPCSVSGPYVFKFCYDSDNGKFYMGGDAGWSTHDSGATPETSAAPTSTNYLFDNIIYDVTPLFYAFQMTTMTDNMHNFGQDASFGGNVTGTPAYATDENGYGEFYYEPPAGYNALCTANLPSPSIALPGENFNTKLYTGTGAELAVTGVGFQPDFTWIKTRTLAYNHRVFDVIRGATKEVYTNVTNAEVTDAQSLKSFDSDGFTLGTGSGSNPSSTMVSWNWKGGGTAVSNTDGSITSSVSANTTAGFSIVKWTGTGSNATVGHGLSQAPEMIINKSLDSAHNWAVQSTLFVDASNTNMLYLNTDAAEADDTNVFQAAPTASVFSPQGGAWAGIGANGTDYIAYCFHSVEGYSKIGKYTGNASADGVFVYTGFRPAFLIAKNYGAAGKPWVMYDDKRDTYNEMYKQLVANDSAAANTSEGRLDFVSNGIKWRIGDSYHNDGSFIYIAFAANPFKTSNAR